MRNEKEKEAAPKLNVAKVDNIGFCIKSFVKKGYTELFTITQRGLYALKNGRYYRPEQIKIQSVLKHDSTRIDDQNVMAYILESTDGVRGTLVDYFDKKPDSLTAKFIMQAEELQRKYDRYNRQY